MVDPTLNFYSTKSIRYEISNRCVHIYIYLPITLVTGIRKWRARDKRANPLATWLATVLKDRQEAVPYPHTLNEGPGT